MQTLEYRTVDKTNWKRGPWDNEPDKVQWRDEATGLLCLIVRGPTGALCGYVGVSTDHPWHGKDYNSVDVDVHGGLTFSGGCSHGEPEDTICHVVEAGEPDDVWWLGFDCAHYGDQTDMARGGYMPGGLYRDLPYVRSEVESLARQIAEPRP